MSKQTAAGNVSSFDLSTVIEPARFYYYKGIAQILDCPESAVYDWIYRGGRLPYVQLPKGRRVLGADLIKFLTERYVGTEDK